MKIFIICSKAFYADIPPFKKKLEEKGHTIFLPNSYDNPSAEANAWSAGNAAHAQFKKEMFKLSDQLIAQMDAVLCLNFEKNEKANYIGGATFLELYEAFMKDKKIYLYNEIPEGMLFDEIHGFAPVVLHGNLDLIQ